ncbi:MAG: cytochrome [Alphaproteobacteria bacterium]|nr:cytochrome [Alphaproteobacteria bacterium]
MWWRSLLVVSILMLVAGGVILIREERSDSTTPAAGAARSDAITMSNVTAGGSPVQALPGPEVNTHEEVSAYDVAEGKRLYHWFNCNTCHANGGGDIGPPLMDNKWLYGAEPRNIHASILEGRPNGMPSFRGKIPDEQVWQLVAYIRSMGGNVPFYAEPSRDDDIAAKPPETMAPKEPMEHGANPAAPMP